MPRSDSSAPRKIVAAADDDRDLHALADGVGDLGAMRGDHVGVDAELASPAERLTGQLQQHPLPAVRRRRPTAPSGRLRSHLGRPSAYRAAARVEGRSPLSYADSTGDRRPRRQQRRSSSVTTPPDCRSGTLCRSGADLEPGEPGHRNARASSAPAATVFLLSCTEACSSSTLSLKKPLTRPSTIFGQRLLRLALLAGGRLGDAPLLLDAVLRGPPRG